MSEQVDGLRRVTRIGVYGIAICDGLALLTVKKGGCFKGLLDLPGGGIEFGESPEQTLRREFLEEVAMTFDTMQLLDNLSHTRSILQVEDPFHFHHLGLIYRVSGCVAVPGLPCEEEFAWYPIKDLQNERLTPFAQHIKICCEE
ncbi:MAG: pyrophosphohydrolase [Chlamydiia bacterium]|nr:pyrophosphohydrolase [Chlamydiia bacterium]